MNYLDLVNNVLKRMREDTVSGINENVLSTLVATFVNDAKRQVEDSWDWSSLRDTFTVPTVSGTKTYSLTGTQNRATILDVQNTTTQYWMQPKSQKWGRYQSLSTSGNSTPAFYVMEKPDSSGDTQISFYPTPDGVYSIDVNLVQRDADLVAEGDETSLPAQPIIQLAFAMASRESGEAGGNTAQELFALANRVLGDAVAYDSALNPTDLVWYQV